MGSLKFRLTAIHATIFAGFLLVFSAGIYGLAATRLWHDFDRDIDRDATAYSKLVEEEWSELKSGAHSPENWLEEIRTLPGLLGASVTLMYSDGRLVFRTSDLESLPPPRVSELGWRTEYFALGHHPGNFRILTLDLSKSGPPMILEFARPTASLARFLHRMGLALLVGVPLLIVLAFFAGYLFIRRTIRPVVEMAGLAQEISAGDLARRVPLPGSEGEFRQLAVTLNGMLARLEDSFSRMRTFTSNSAHELKTPVAAIRSALEMALGRQPKEMEESIRDALEELEHLTEITEKLLLLARADAGHLLGEVRQVNLDELAHQVASAFEVPASQRGMALVVEGGPATAPADAALLRRAIHNLVENAVKYGRGGGTIRIRVTGAGVDIIDDGPGIDPAHRSQLFDRFHRADPSRSNRIPGSGLGLAIVKSIVEAHGGAVRVDSEPGRTVFSLTLPAVAGAAGAPV